MPTCERFDVVIDGSVGSKSPGVAECFLAWCLMRGDEEPVCVGVRPPLPPAGREKFWCRLELLALDCAVAKWEYIGVAGEPACWRVLWMVMDGVSGASSLSSGSGRWATGRIGGREWMALLLLEAAAAAAAEFEVLVPPGRGEKLPGARGWCRDILTSVPEA